MENNERILRTIDNINKCLITNYELLEEGKNHVSNIY